MSTAVRNVIVFKAGARPSNEPWYVSQVCEAIGLSSGQLEGARIDVQYVSADQLNRGYIMGFVTAAGHDVANCTLTPFNDADGGSGMVVKVRA